MIRQRKTYSLEVAVHDVERVYMAQPAQNLLYLRGMSQQTLECAMNSGHIWHAVLRGPVAQEGGNVSKDHPFADEANREDG